LLDSLLQEKRVKWLGKFLSFQASEKHSNLMNGQKENYVNFFIPITSLI